MMQRLSDREMIVLRLIAQGMTQIEVGQTMYVTPNTVKTHCRRIMRKLNAKNMAHAVAMVASAGVVRVPFPTSLHSSNEGATRA